MANEIKRLEHLVDIAGAIIETPELSLKDFGIVNDPKTLLLTYTDKVSPAAVASYVAITSASTSLAGMTAIVSGSFLGGMGLIAGSGMAGAISAASGLSATGVGITVAPFVLAGGYVLYRSKKRKQQEKDRIYREIIKKQQVAIARQREINRELEQRLRNIQQKNAQSRSEIDELRQKIANLTELIRVLTEQQENFKAA